MILLVATLFACETIKSTTSSVSTTSHLTSGEDISSLKELSLNDSPLVRWIGRTHYDEIESARKFYYTGTGFVVKFIGTELTITLSGTNTDVSTKRPYFTVSVDDEVAPVGRTFILTQPEMTLTVAEGLTYGEHTVTFLKRSEAEDSTNSISSISTDGFFQTAPPASDYKVLIIGGSGISGHGNLGTQYTSCTTANSDSLQSFGYLTARALQADFQFVSASGWGLVWGYNATNRNGTVNIRTAFDKIGIGDDSELIDIEYDHQEFIPDIIIVNIGGNDYTDYVLKQTGDALVLAKLQFRQAVAEFVTHLHTLYPDARILWTHTGSQNGSEAAVAIGDLDPKSDYTSVVIINKVGSEGDPIGADNHASVITHQKIANALVSLIQTFQSS
jgi:hypothetical protein